MELNKLSHEHLKFDKPEIFKDKEVFVLWGGSNIEDGYNAIVLDENEKELSVKTDKRFEVLHHWSYGSTFFLSKEDAIQSRLFDKNRNDTNKIN